MMSPITPYPAPFMIFPVRKPATSPTMIHQSMCLVFTFGPMTV